MQYMTTMANVYFICHVNNGATKPHHLFWCQINARFSSKKKKKTRRAISKMPTTVIVIRRVAIRNRLIIIPMNFFKGHIHAPNEWRHFALGKTTWILNHRGGTLLLHLPWTARRLSVLAGYSCAVGPANCVPRGSHATPQTATCTTDDRADGHAETTGGCGAGIRRE